MIFSSNTNVHAHYFTSLMVVNHNKRSDIGTFCFLQANNVPDSCKRERLMVVKVEQIEQWEDYFVRGRLSQPISILLRIAQVSHSTER